MFRNPGLQPKIKGGSRRIRQTYGRMLEILSLFNQTHQSPANPPPHMPVGWAEPMPEDRCWRKIRAFFIFYQHKGYRGIPPKQFRRDGEENVPYFYLIFLFIFFLPVKVIFGTHRATWTSHYTKMRQNEAKAKHSRSPGCRRLMDGEASQEERGGVVGGRSERVFANIRRRRLRCRSACLLLLCLSGMSSSYFPLLPPKKGHSRELHLFVFAACQEEKTST